MKPINRIHHISAIVGSSQENLWFYRTVLQLRLIKQTVNFDDPNVYHLYFDNENKKAVITFFPWENAYQGRKGGGQVGRIAFRVPKGSLMYWQERLQEFNVPFEKNTLFGSDTLVFSDAHTLDLALVESDEESDTPNILDFHGAVLLSTAPEKTMSLLTDELGFVALQQDEEYAHFKTNSAEAHHILIPRDAVPAGRWGVGTVHHIAWSLDSNEEQREWQDYLFELGFGVTEVKDRQYFNAIYMREWGGIIFEYATVAPGFAVDEPEDALGTQLKLPPQYEPMRESIQAHLVPLIEKRPE